MIKLTKAHVCARKGCNTRFRPQYRRHIFCSEGCWTCVLHEEIGRSAAGMRPFGLFGDRGKVQTVLRKYGLLSPLGAP